MLRLALLWLLAVESACAGGEGQVMAAPNGAVAEPANAGRTMVAASEELARRIATLVDPSLVPTTDAVLGSMYALSDLIAALSSSSERLRTAGVRMHDAALELESLPANAPATADITRGALGGVTAALAAEPASTPAFAKRVALARAAVLEIVMATPLAEQTAALQRAFCAVGDAVLTSAQQYAGLGVCRAASVSVVPSAVVLPYVESLRGIVRDVASDDLDSSRLAAARGFEQLAAAVQRISTPTPEADWAVTALSDQAAAMRLDVERGDETAADVLEGLRAGLLALDELAEQRRPRPEALQWLEEAKRAVEGIHGSEAYVNQRAPIQDAYRTLVDAFAIIVEPAL